MYDRLSNLGSHPHTLKSAWNDGRWNEEQEEDVLRFGVIFAYAIAAQYIRTFENSQIERFVREEMDDVIVQVLLVFGHLPEFLEKDLDPRYSDSPLPCRSLFEHDHRRQKRSTD